jgi:hypothetical protein
MKKTIIIAICLASLIISSSMPVSLAAEVVDWSDNFDDGNYDDWTVVTGAYAVTDGKLTVTDMAPGPAFPVIHHQSNTSFGNWSFDVEIGNDPEEIEHVVICFMRDFGGDGWLGGVGDTDIYMEYFSGGWHLGKGFDDYDYFPAELQWEHHIRVERNSTDPNYIKVYHNDTLYLDTLMLIPDSDYGYFSFLGTRGATIDNIVVANETIIDDGGDDTTSTTTTSTEITSDDTTTSDGTGSPPDMTMILLIAGGGVAVLIVVVLAVKMKT